jgi:hypothetical protein
LRSDGGFEDREDHQAPVTLQKVESGVRAGLAFWKAERLFELFDLADDLIEVRPIAGIEFGMEQFAIGANFKSAAARRNEGERFDALAEFENLGRQTDGLRRVVSNDAIFDRDFGFHLARSFPANGTEVGKGGQGSDYSALDGRVAGQVNEGRPRRPCHDRPSNPFHCALRAQVVTITKL